MSSYEGLCPDCQQLECDEACIKATSNVKLLPLPKHSGKATDMFGQKTKLYNGIQMQDHARDCVEANTKYYRDMLCQSQDDVMKLSAETEALRAEVQFLRSHRPIARKLGEAEAEVEALKERNETQLRACIEREGMLITRVKTASAEVEALRAEVDRLDAEARQHMKQALSNGQAAITAEAHAEDALLLLREAQKLFEWNAIGGPLRRRIDALLNR